MRPKMTARKSCGGTFTSKQYSEILDIQEQRFAETGHIQQMAKKDKLDNTSGASPNIPACSPQSAITVVPCASMKMIEKISQQIEQRTHLITTSTDQQSIEEMGIDNFTLQISCSPEEMALSKRIDLSSSKEKGLPNKLSINKISEKRKTCSKSESHEQLLASTSRLNETPMKKSRTKKKSSVKETPKKKKSKNDKSLFKKLIEKYGKGALMLETSKEIDLEQMLEAYKETKPEEAVKQEASRVLGLDTRNGSMDAAQMSCLQNILSELCKLYGSDNFSKTIRDRLKPSEILEVFSINEVIEALLKKYSAVELVNLLTRSDPSVVNEISKAASVDEIINLVCARNELNTLEPLLQVMLESFSQVVPDKLSPNLEDAAPMASTSQITLISALTNAVKSRKCLSSSEDLLNVMLHDGPKILSEESKQNIKNILKKKFSGPEFNDISHAVTRFHLGERVIEVD